MKIYITGNPAARPKTMSEIADALMDAGHEVGCQWWRRKHTTLERIRALCEATVVIGVMPFEQHSSAEYGLAVGRMKPIVLHGMKSSIMPGKDPLFAIPDVKHWFDDGATPDDVVAHFAEKTTKRKTCANTEGCLLTPQHRGPCHTDPAVLATIRGRVVITNSAMVQVACRCGTDIGVPEPKAVQAMNAGGAFDMRCNTCKLRYRVERELLVGAAAPVAGAQNIAKALATMKQRHD